MFDLIILFTLFVGLVGLLALVHQWQVSRSTQSHAFNMQLLREWLLAHKLELPSVPGLLSILNRRLQEMESEDWERLELIELLPRTDMPIFDLLQAELSEDGRDMTFCCDVAWPMCLPGVKVSVLEKGAEEPVICHFSIDWLEAKIRVVFGEKNGVLMLSSQNMQPVRMGVSCMVAEGQAKDAERVASYVADAIQLVLMDLRLEEVPVVSLYGHTPSLPLVLVSTPEETQPPPNSNEVTPTNPPTLSEELDTPHVDDSVSQESGVLTQQISDLAATTPTGNDVITPISEEVDPICDNKETGPLVSSPSPTSTQEQLANGLSHVTMPLSSEGEQQEASNDSSEELPVVSATPPTSPGWRRTSSYENLEEIPISVGGPSGSKGRATSFKGPVSSTPKPLTLRGSSSTEHLASPSRRGVSSPMTLSMAGSEAESIYGADDRIPSSLVFEVSDSIKVRHIVAISTTHASKLRRHFSNAKKLHIYNDHSFLATHLKNKTDCAVCKEKISKLFGKQGYMCRDCDMVVHKQCHYKVETVCPTSSVSSMNLIYPETTSVSGL